MRPMIFTMKADAPSSSKINTGETLPFSGPFPVSNVQEENNMSNLKFAHHEKSKCASWPPFLFSFSLWSIFLPFLLVFFIGFSLAKI